MPPRKPYLLRVSPEVWDALNRLASAELRSVNSQIEMILREGLARRGYGLSPPSPPSQPEGGEAGEGRGSSPDE